VSHSVSACSRPSCRKRQSGRRQRGCHGSWKSLAREVRATGALAARRGRQCPTKLCIAIFGRFLHSPWERAVLSSFRPMIPRRLIKPPKMNWPAEGRAAVAEGGRDIMSFL
jgi:hypothetical protein